MRLSPLLALGLLSLSIACASAPKPSTDAGNPDIDAIPPGEVSVEEATMDRVVPDEERGAVDPADMLGPLTEAGFKALHDMKGEDAPPALGEDITLADGSRAYLALPPGEGPHPAVLVIHEWWGLNQHIKYWADRLAADGYAALAVDLYGGQVGTNPDEAMALMRSVERSAAEATLMAGHTFLEEDPRVQATKQASIGWCFGGGWSLQYGLMAPDLDAVVMYYGKVVTDPAALAGLDAPILGVFANQDQGISVEDVKAFEGALTEAGKSFTLLRFEAQHAFANPSAGARYDAFAAADAWEEVRGFLARTLKDSPPETP